MAPYPAARFAAKAAREKVLAHFQVDNLGALGLTQSEAPATAAVTLLLRRDTLTRQITTEWRLMFEGALMQVDGVDAEEICRRSMKIAADICVYTDGNIVLESLEA